MRSSDAPYYIFLTLFFLAGELLFGPFFEGQNARALFLGLSLMFFLLAVFLAIDVAHLGTVFLALKKKPDGPRDAGDPEGGKTPSLRATCASRGMVTYALSAAPLLGLLGTALGLRGAFATVDPAQLLQSSTANLLSFVAIAINSTILGIGIAVLAYTAQQLLIENLLSMVEQRSRGRGYSPRAIALLAAQPRPGTRVTAGLLAAAIAMALVVFLDSTLVFSEAETPESYPVLAAPPPPEESATEKRQPEAAGAGTIKVPLHELLKLYQQAAVESGFQERIYEWMRYHNPDEIPPHAAGTGGDPRSYVASHLPVIGGIIDIVNPPADRPLLDRMFPRLLARLHVTGGESDPEVAARFVILGREEAGVPVRAAASGEDFAAAVSDLGFKVASGYLVDRLYLSVLISDAFKSRIAGARQANEGRDLGVVLWLAFEGDNKLETMAETRGEDVVDGEVGDYLVLNWESADRPGTEPSKDLTLRGARLLSPTIVKFMLRQQGIITREMS